MNTGIKWIGGATAALVLGVVAIAMAGRGMAGEWDKQPWIDPSPVLESAATDADISAVTPADAAIETVPAADDPFIIKRTLPIEGPIRYGEWHWDDEGVPAGPLVITVDLEARVISVFRDGYEIGAAAVLLGTDKHPTPLGTFPIILKKRHNISSIYNVPMPYTLRLTNDGIAIHASDVENGYASHGCIGTPDDFAARLFEVAQKGDKVIITRGKMVGLGDSLMGS